MQSKSFLLLAILLLVLSGCGAPRNMATVNDTPDAMQFFLNPEIPSGYTFYYHGPDDEPIAYLALSDAYHLQSNFWFPLKMNEATQKRITSLVNANALRSGSGYIGKQIVSPDAETIGYLVTCYHWVTAWFDTEDGNTIIIPPPALSQTQPIPLPLARSRK